MEKLNNNGFNLLIKRFRRNNFLNNKSLFSKTFLYIFKLFLRLLVLKKKTDSVLINNYLKFLVRLNLFFCFRQKQNQKIRFILKKRKKLKLKFLKAIPNIFSTFFFVRTRVENYTELQKYTVYILTNIGANSKFLKNNFLYKLELYYKLWIQRLNLSKNLQKKIKFVLKYNYFFEYKCFYIFSLCKRVNTIKQKHLYFYFLYLIKNFFSFLRIKHVSVNYFISSILKKKNYSLKNFYFKILKFILRYSRYSLAEIVIYFPIIFNLYQVYKVVITKSRIIRLRLITQFEKKNFFFFWVRKIGYSVQKLTLFLCFMQKELELLFSKLLNYQVLIRFHNLFMTAKKIKQLGIMFQATNIYKRPTKFFLATVQAFFAAFYLNSPYLLVQHIAERFSQTGRREKHSHTIGQLLTLLKLMKTCGFDSAGFQILICGKINAKTQTKVQYLKFGNTVKTNTLYNPLNYCYAEAITYTGVFGIHVWLTK